MKSVLKLFFIAALAGLTVTVQSQIKVDLNRKINSKVNQRVNKNVDKTIDKGLDAVENGGKEDPKKTEKTDQTNANQNNQANKSEENDNKTQTDKPGGQEQTQLQSYSKYDFITGEKVIFYEDFSQDAIGDFPALWNTNGSAEVVNTNLFPGHWMKFDMKNCVWTDALLDLPDNYTIEYDIIPITGEFNAKYIGYYMELMQANNAKTWDGGTSPGKGGFWLRVDGNGRLDYRTWLNKQDCNGYGLSGYKDGNQFKQIKNQKYHIAIWVQKSRIRLYQEQDKIFDLPKAFPTGCVKPDRLRFESGAAMVTNIRIAVGAPDMRNKLMTEGKLITYGIYFDVNKDIVKPESYGTLKEISTILNEVPDVKVKIVGFTDSDGADAANLDLSKRRAASVKNELVKSFGVNGDRLVTDGLGEGQPVAPNDTPANKALNRRVEFIKL